MLTYEGAHHFESPLYADLQQVDGAHILPTCTINYDKEAFMYLKKRDGSGSISEKTTRSIRKWVGKNCLKRGNLQGYNKESAFKLWQDVKLYTSSE